MDRRYSTATPLLRNTPFALFWCSRVLSTLALRMQTVAVGWQLYTLCRRLLLGLLSLDLFAVLLGDATALLPIYARDILGAGPWGLGLLRAGPAVGALAMSLVPARRPVEHRAGPVLCGAVLVLGVATVAFGASTSLPLSLAALGALGASDLLSVGGGVGTGTIVVVALWMHRFPELRRFQPASPRAPRRGAPPAGAGALHFP